MNSSSSGISIFGAYQFCQRKRLTSASSASLGKLEDCNCCGSVTQNNNCTEQVRIVILQSSCSQHSKFGQYRCPPPPCPITSTSSRSYHEAQSCKKYGLSVSDDPSPPTASPIQPSIRPRSREMPKERESSSMSVSRSSSGTSWPTSVDMAARLSKPSTTTTTGIGEGRWHAWVCLLFSTLCFVAGRRS